MPRFRDQMVASRVPGLLLIGTIGSGKTALGAEIGDISAESGVPTAVIDLDWLGWLTSQTHSGDVIHRLIVGNLAKIWPNFKALGAHRLVLMRTLGSRSEADDICAAVPDVELKIVRLAVSRDTVVQRLERRDTGSTLNTHLQESLDFARALESDPFEDFLVNAERPPDELARFVLQEVEWL